MRTFLYAALVLSWESRLRALAKPVATAEENLFTSLDDGGDDPLFSSLDDGTLAGTGANDMGVFTAGLDNSDPSIANAGDDASSCPSEVGLGGTVDDGTLALGNSNDWLTSRDLDDNNLFADSKTTTCVSPGVGSSRKKQPNPHMPNLGGLMMTPYDSGQDCHSDHPDQLCCGIVNGMTPRDCDVCTY